MDPSLSDFFNPQGVVIVGASADPAKLGHFIARNMLRSGYHGAVHFVNVKGGELFDRPIYRSAVEVPDPADLAVLIVPAVAVPAALEDVARRGIKAAVVASGGFRETGAEGAALEEECLKIVHSHGMRLIGPNCIGLIDMHLPLDTSFATQLPPPRGDIGLISQSGAVCGVIIDWAYERGFGFSHLVSLGNQGDVNETDMLPGVAADEHTLAVTFYIENLRDGRRFVETAAEVAQLKPLVAMKVGRSAAGQQAAASHTGALAGEQAAYEAAFRRAGVLQAAGIEDLFGWADALAHCPLPKGNRIAILTDAGGPGVIAADVLEPNALRLAKLSKKTVTNLAALLPPAASLQNPVDMLGSATRRDYAECLRVLLADEGVDGVIIILPPPPVDTPEVDAAAMIPLIRGTSKPVVIALMGGPSIRKAADLFHEAHIPEYRFPEQAASALSALVRRGEFLKRGRERARHWEDYDLQAAKVVLVKAQPGTFLDAEAANRLMVAAGIPVASLRLARSADEAAVIASQMGFPVAMKVASADIIHKSDAGGVRLNIKTEREARSTYRQLTGMGSQKTTGLRIAGALVQKMAAPGQEVILGVKRDPQFGPLVMFGSGGVEVEGLKDVAFALSPLPLSEADYLLQHTWAGRKLAGFRSLPKADAEAVKEILQRLALLAEDLPQISEMEINPLRVLEAGRGAVALDVRVKLADVSG